MTASVNASASGTHIVNPNTILFTLQNVTGTVGASGTVHGQPFSRTWTLGQSGEIHELYGLSGSANYTCNADGSLTLSLPTEQLHFR